jgi:uncharacterized protein involved in exopolysaccharide biosynthesis
MKYAEPENDVREKGEEKPKGNYNLKSTEPDQLDLYVLVKEFLSRWRVLSIITIIVTAIGIIVAFSIPDKYESNAILLPESGGTGSSVASGLLRQFGGLINAGGKSGGSLSAVLYPDIVQSTPFYLDLMQDSVVYQDTKITIYQYFTEKYERPTIDYIIDYTIKLPATLFRIFKSFGSSSSTQNLSTDSNNTSTEDRVTKPSLEILALTPQQASVINKIKSRIKVGIEPNGTLKVEVEMPSALLSAAVAKSTVKYLTDYITEYRTDKAQQNLEFIRNQHADAEKKYRDTQNRLARFRDRNLNIISETNRIELRSLELENNLAFNLYESLSQQLEQAKIKVQEDTPAFKVLEPVQIPLSNSGPNREFIIIGSVILGGIFGSGIVLLFMAYGKFQERMKEESA